MAARKTSKATARRSSSKIPKLNLNEPEDDEEEDDDEDVEVAQQLLTYNASTHAIYPIGTPTYNPVSHVAIPVDTHFALVNAKASLDASSVALNQSNNRQIESLVLGFSTGNSQLQEQISKDREYADRQRAIADEYRDKYIKTERSLSEMMRQSEDAKLERERLQADARNADRAMERLELELNAKLRGKQQELDALKSASAPVFLALGTGLSGVISQYAGKMAGVATTPASPALGGPAAAPAAPPTPQVRVSGDRTEEFKGAFRDVYESLGPQAIAGLRAVVCSTVLGATGAPPLPKEVKDGLLMAILSDAGEDKVRALMAEAGNAYVAVEAPAAANAPN